MLSDDVAVALAPAQAYARLVVRSRDVSWWRALERPLLVLLVIGTAITIAAVGRVTLSGIASSMLLWSWVVLVQVALGALLIGSSRSRQVSMPAALDLFFAAHLPWSLWVVGVGMWAASDLSFSLELAICLGLIFTVWTSVVLTAFSRTVLHATGAGASARIVAHQVAIWFVALSYIAWMSGGWFRLVIW